MFAWTPYTFVRILLFFCAGILLGIYLPNVLPLIYSEILFGVLVVSFIAVAYAHSKGRVKFFNPGTLALTALLLAGYIRVYYTTDRNQADHIIHEADAIRYYRAVVVKQAQEKKNSWKVEAAISAVQDGKRGWEQKSGRVLLYLSKKTFRDPYQYGDVLLIEGSPALLQEPSNPGEFDYKRFLTFRKTYHQHFLRGDNVLLIGHEPPNMILYYATRARVWADAVLKQNVQGEREQAIASALVLGVTDGLDNELIHAYSASGAMHVLAVSGLHVGIIYWILLLVLRPLNKYQSGKWALAVISILVLWGYAFVTGLSPSVLRAVTMFSFVALARPWGKRTNIYNTLAASACCLLMFEPYLIMSVGFQLSYLAVIGIVYVQPLLYRFWEFENYWLDKAWQITCVSIAAQLATFSLGLLYFHQFPAYFLFSNLFVIPGSFGVLVLGIVTVLAGAIQPLASVLGFLLEWCIRIMNYMVFGVEELPFSLIDNIYITTFQCWLLMGGVAFGVWLIIYRKFAYAIVAASCLILFASLQWIHAFSVSNQSHLTIYKVTGQSVWDITDQGRSYFFADSVFAHDTERIRFHIRPNRLQQGVGKILLGDQQAFVRELSGGRLIQWKGTAILQVYDRDFLYPDSLVVDYVVIGKNALRKATSLEAVKYRTLILDSSNSYYFTERIVKEMDSRSVHAVLQHGAFIAKL